MPVRLLAAVIAACLAICAGNGAARADYCVGTDCGSGQDDWHLHGCWDLTKGSDGGNPRDRSYEYCSAVAECWDQQDSTCEIMSDWAFKLSDEECASSSSKVAATDSCAERIKRDLTQEKARREQEALKAAEAARRAEEAAREAEETAIQDEMAREFDETTGSGTPDDAAGRTSQPKVQPQSRPPPNNPWTPKGGQPLVPRGTIVDPAFLAKVPCSICVSYADGPTIDVKYVADSVPAHKAAAAAAASDATSLALHVATSERQDQALGISIAGTDPAAPGGGAFGMAPSSGIGVVARDDAGVTASPQVELDQSTRDEIHAAQELVGQFQPTKRERENTERAASCLADPMNGCVVSSPPLGDDEYRIKVYLVNGGKYTGEDLWHDATKKLEEVNSAIAGFIRGWVSIPPLTTGVDPDSVDGSR